ncbi:MAG: PIN domain-containing protein [Porphyromonadaceae bacterium]|nr:PIN domain-containing protein [Porphyromonadaceae bacterium]
MLVFILSRQFDEIDSHIMEILNDYSSIIYTSNIAVQELILLYRIGKFKSIFYKSEDELLGAIEESGIRIIYFNKYHLDMYTFLQIARKHKDMNDHAIIAQAISDKIPLISSDYEFHHYVEQGLDYIFNKR